MNKRTLHFTLLGVAIIALLAIGYVIIRLLNPPLGFTYYEPTYLPPNVSIKAKRVSVGPGHLVQAEQNFRTEDWVYSIGEYKPIVPIGTANQNYDSTSVKPTCSMETSPGKMSYRLCHWIDYGRIDVHEVKFIKDGTFVDARIPSDLDQRISVEQISRFVDSFVPKSTTGIPVLRTNGS